MANYTLAMSDGEAVLIPPRPGRVLPPYSPTMYLAGPEEDKSLMLQYKIDQLTSTVKEDMIKTAAAQAAVNLALIVGLNSVPIIGNAVSAAWSAVQMLSARYNKSQLQGVIDDLQNNLQTKAAQVKASLVPAQNAAIKEEAPAAATLAMSNMPLSGGVLDFLRDTTSTIREKAVNVAKKAATMTVKKLPASYLTKGIAKVVGAGANAVGATSVAKAADKVDTGVNAMTEKLVDAGGERLANPLQLVQDAKKAALTVTGYQAVDDAKKKADEAFVLASQQMDETAVKALEDMKSPLFRANLRRIIALKMRDDPNYMQQVADANSVFQNQMKASGLSLGVKIGIGVGTVAVLGLLAYLILSRGKRR